MPTNAPKQLRTSREPARRQSSTSRPPATTAEHPAATAPAATQPQRLLLGVAHQAGIGDPDTCRTVLAVLSASRAIRRVLARELGTEDITESRFATLVTLYALEPMASTAADLAFHSEVSRSAMTDVIDALEQRGWVARGAHGRDRRLTPIHLTQLGCEVTVTAVHRFLQVASQLAAGLTLAERRATVSACERIERRAAAPDSAAA